MTFREWLTTTLAPPRLRRVRGARLVYGIGLVFDTMSQAVADAVAARFVSRTPGDGLAAAGAERGIARGPSESEASFRERVRTAWTAWAHAGEATTLVEQLAIYGVRANLYGAEFLAEWPKNTANWSRFWLIIEYATDWPWGSGAPPADAQADLAKIIRQWKPAHWVCPSVTVVTDSQSVTWQRVQDRGLKWSDLTNKALSGLPRQTWATTNNFRFSP